MPDNSRITVLMYHRVDRPTNDGESRYAIEPKRFAAQMHALEKRGYQAIGIDCLVDWLEGKTASLPEKAFVLTFDDGFLDVHDHAWPVLRHMGWPFTVFVVSNRIGEDDNWTRTVNPTGVSLPLMSLNHLQAMQAAGVSIHSHTRHHASLTACDDTTLKDELAGSRQQLAEVFGTTVDYIAYPYGHVDQRVEAAARQAGYRAGFSTQSGFNRRDVNRFHIRRLDVYGTDTPAMLLRKMTLGSNEGGLMPIMRYYWNQALSRMLNKAA